MKKLFSFLILFLFLLMNKTPVYSQTPPQPSSPQLLQNLDIQKYHSGADKICPCDKAIVVKTEKGMSYQHIEGKKPDWKRGILNQIVTKHPLFQGDGNSYLFIPESKHHYQIVQSIENQGCVTLSLKGATQSGYQYIIRQGDENVLSGMVSADNLTSPLEISLPYGNYTLQIIAIGYETPPPMEFNLSERTTNVSLSCELSAITAKVNLTTQPLFIGDGKEAIARKIDPLTSQVIQEFSIPLNSQTPFSLPEGDYTIEFPRCAHYLPPGQEGILGKFKLSYDNQVHNIEGNYILLPGILGVNLKTNPHMDYLDQVFFTLEDAETGHILTMEKSIVHDNLTEKTRRYQLENLKPGLYHLQIFSNLPSDYLKIPPSQTITIQSEETTELTYELPIQYAQARIKLCFFPKESNPQDAPLISLINDSGSVVAQNKTTQWECLELLPGAYRFSFGELPSFVTPKDIAFHIAPQQTVSFDNVEYIDQDQLTTIHYSTGPQKERLDRVRFWIVDAEGNRTMYPQGDEFEEDGNERVVTLKGLSCANYKIEFLIPNQDGLFGNYASIYSFTKESKFLNLSYSFMPSYGSIEAMIDLDYLPKETKETLHPQISLKDDRDCVITTTNTSTLFIDNLKPGLYTVCFQEIEGVTSPESFHVRLDPQEHIGPLIGTYGIEQGTLNLTSNQNDKEWCLKNSQKEIIISKIGSANAIRLPEGTYYFYPESMHGYETNLKAEQEVVIKKRETCALDLKYQEAFGQLCFEVFLSQGEKITLSIDNNDVKQLHYSWIIQGTSNPISWESPMLPIGSYTVHYELSSDYQPLSPDSIVITENSKTVLKPSLLGCRELKITTNEPQARFSLYYHDNLIGEGQGSEFVFVHLIPGHYTLKPTSLTEQKKIAHESFSIEIPQQTNTSFSFNYETCGTLLVSSNVSDFDIKLKRLDIEAPSLSKTIEHYSTQIDIAEGRYLLEFEPLNHGESSRYGNNHPDSSEIMISQHQLQRVHGNYTANSGSLIVTTNLSHASYSVIDLTDGKNILIGRFKGTYTIVPLTYIGMYRIEFDSLPNYKTPEPITVKILEGEKKVTGAVYLPKEKVARIPKGPMIIGDTFGDGSEAEHPSKTIELDEYLIGLYPVTNAQYAAWLTQASKDNKIFVLETGPVKGQVKNGEGQLLFETKDADSDSQIIAKKQGSYYVFEVEAGKEEFPVIEVSWYGAMAYCQDNGYTLPTQAQWEKAAGMYPYHPGQPLKKFRYGCSKDTITKSQANYRTEYETPRYASPLTTPVGFYNGVNFIAPQSTVQQAYQKSPENSSQNFGSEKATSPYGIYDMSGNVREWVADWYDKNYLSYIPENNPEGPGHGIEKITKGGSYNSFAYDLRVSAQSPLPPETTDAFTGFRIVIRCPKDSQ